MPVTSRVAWQATQMECPDLRQAHHLLRLGTPPSKKVTNHPDLKRYLRVASIANDGLLVVRDDPPFQPTKERIIIPHGVLQGLLTALPIRCDHPSQHQLKQVFSRYYFARKADAAIKATYASCHLCQSLAAIPSHLMPQSTSDPPTKIGSTFSADVMRRYGQMVMLITDKVSSYTATCFINEEKTSYPSECYNRALCGYHSLQLRYYHPCGSPPQPCFASI